MGQLSSRLRALSSSVWPGDKDLRQGDKCPSLEPQLTAVLSQAGGSMMPGGRISLDRSFHAPGPHGLTPRCSCCRARVAPITFGLSKFSHQRSFNSYQLPISLASNGASGYSCLASVKRALSTSLGCLAEVC
jgi:hypothetical protein